MLTFSLLSANKVKLEALDKALKRYGIKEYKIVPKDGESGVSAQPKSIEETLQGARLRAQNAFACGDSDYGVGIECGVFNLPQESAYFNISAAVIYDGQNFFKGFSPVFVHPQIINSSIENGADISQAYKMHKLCDHENVGSANGAIGIISKNNMNRVEYCSYAALMALFDWASKYEQ